MFQKSAEVVKFRHILTLVQSRAGSVSPFYIIPYPYLANLDYDERLHPRRVTL